MSNRFYQMPLYIINEQQYSILSNDAKIAYMLLYNRYRLSETRERYIDKYGVFIYFTREEMQKALNVGKNTTIKVFKELTNVGLIREIKDGMHYKIYLNRT